MQVYVIDEEKVKPGLRLLQRVVNIRYAFAALKVTQYGSMYQMLHNCDDAERKKIYRTLQDSNPDEKIVVRLEALIEHLKKDRDYQPIIVENLEAKRVALLEELARVEESLSVIS